MIKTIIVLFLMLFIFPNIGFTNNIGTVTLNGQSFPLTSFSVSGSGSNLNVIVQYQSSENSDSNSGTDGQPDPILPPVVEINDPGTPLWRIPGTNIRVFNRVIGGGDVNVPGCIPNRFSNCAYSGSIRAGEIWSMRMPFKGTGRAEIFSIDIRFSETGETYTQYQGAVSRIPGDFDVPSACLGTSFSISDDTAGPLPFRRPPETCKLSAGNMYYLNVRPRPESPGETRCGIGNETCRFRITNKMESAFY